MEPATFRFSRRRLNPEALRRLLARPGAGGFVSFEGCVRDHNEGRAVRRLEYEAYEELAEREGGRVVAAAVRRFGVAAAVCVHRLGTLAPGEIAVWAGVAGAHRSEAFAACRYIIDRVKARVPIWKKEHYRKGSARWLEPAHAGRRRRASSKKT